MSDTSPNPLKVAWSVWRATRVRRPNPVGDDQVDHSGFQPVLGAVAAGGVDGIGEVADELARYIAHLETIDPDALPHDEALAFWLNGYNAGALGLARNAKAEGTYSVLGLGDGFDRPVLTVAGRSLSLNQIEHGKVRRFGDPRIHFGLVCGSLSCPSLAPEPFGGLVLQDQLDRQARAFLAAGGAQPDEANGRLRLSRILLWYGADFARPHRMPAWLPASRRRVARAISRWLDPSVAAWIEESQPSISFLPYDWGLGCSIR